MKTTMTNRSRAAIQVGAIALVLLVIVVGALAWSQHTADERVQRLTDAMTDPAPPTAYDAKWDAILAGLTPAERVAVCAGLGQDPPPVLEEEWPASGSPEYVTAVAAVAVMCMNP